MLTNYRTSEDAWKWATLTNTLPNSAEISKQDSGPMSTVLLCPACSWLYQHKLQKQLEFYSVYFRVFADTIGTANLAVQQAQAHLAQLQQSIDTVEFSHGRR